MSSARGRARARGFSLIELIIVIAVMIVISAMAVPIFGSTLARMRMQSSVAQVVQDLRQVRDTAILYQQDLYVYICTNPAADRTAYSYELFQKDPTNATESLKHYTPADAPVSGKFISKTVPYSMEFGLPVQSGSAYAFTPVTVGGKQYFVLAFRCGKGSNFRGQPTLSSGTTFSSAIGIPIVDAANSRTWYVSLSPTGRSTAEAVSP